MPIAPIKNYKPSVMGIPGAEFLQLAQPYYWYDMHVPLRMQNQLNPHELKWMMEKARHEQDLLDMIMTHIGRNQAVKGLIGK